MVRRDRVAQRVARALTPPLRSPTPKPPRRKGFDAQHRQGALSRRRDTAREGLRRRPDPAARPGRCHHQTSDRVGRDRRGRRTNPPARLTKDAVAHAVAARSSCPIIVTRNARGTRLNDSAGGIASPTPITNGDNVSEPASMKRGVRRAMLQSAERSATGGWIWTCGVAERITARVPLLQRAPAIGGRAALSADESACESRDQQAAPHPERSSGDVARP